MASLSRWFRSACFESGGRMTRMAGSENWDVRFGRSHRGFPRAAAEDRSAMHRPGPLMDPSASRGVEA